MSESGGPTTQSGIFYQNSVAALKLAELLELSPIPPRDRVLEVRVESPDHVDDIVVRYADGHRAFLQVKTNVAVGTSAWTGLWKNLLAQFNDIKFRADDELWIVFEELNSVTRSLRDICDRAGTSVDWDEFRSRLTASLESVADSVLQIVSDSAVMLQLLRRTSTRVLSQDELQDEFARRQFGGGRTLPATLLAVLRDVCGGAARRRSILLAPSLRQTLISKHGINITEPAEWGLGAYRSVVSQNARIEIPGTGISNPAEKLFVWPRLQEYNRNHHSDFEDEYPEFSRIPNVDKRVDLRSFPSVSLKRCVVIAGPGYGKSALLVSMAGMLSESPYVPVVIPLATLSDSTSGVIDFLSVEINRDFEVSVDWRRLAEQGLLVLLFDGLDEIPTSRRHEVMARIKLFSARYPNSPWVLTVRDAAILPELNDSKLLEILPLDDSDLEEFISRIRPDVVGRTVTKMIDALRAYPDVYRLTRIPLFLAMLLGMVGDVTALPTNRADLIEAYLKTLFSPHEHKEVRGGMERGALLRLIAESLAFDLLEAQQIGATEREIRKIIARQGNDNDEIEYLFAHLTRNGILRRQSSVRLVFPFPIVQEYLAACHLIRVEPDAISRRFDDAVQRPWAQAIQFALEMHSAPNELIREMLTRQDDAFCTGLRLIGRCVVNGANVDDALRGEVQDRLVDYWTSAPTIARERTGRLIVDGFNGHLSIKLKTALHHRWLINVGAGEIISKVSNDELTMSVVSALLTAADGRFFHYPSIAPAINATGNEGFKFLIEYGKEKDSSSGQVEAAANFLSLFSSENVSRNLSLAAGESNETPLPLRLEAYRIAGAPLSAQGIELVQSILANGDASYSVDRLIDLIPNTADFLANLLGNEGLPTDLRRDLASRCAPYFATASERDEFYQANILRNDLPLEVVNVLKLFAARYGNQAAFESLVEQMDRAPIQDVGRAVGILGHYPSRELAEFAAQQARTRVQTPLEACVLSSAAVHGMRYVFNMDWGFGGALLDAPPHAAIATWIDLVESWLNLNGFDVIQKLGIYTDASRLGSAVGLELLAVEVLSLTEPDHAMYDADDYGHKLSSAIREVGQHGRRIPISLSENFVRAQRPNVPYAGVEAITQHGDINALSSLIALQREKLEWGTRDSLANAIEYLASKLSILVRKDEAGAFFMAER